MSKRVAGTALAVCSACAVFAPAPASAEEVLFTSKGCSAWEVPANVKSELIEAIGAAGEAGGSILGGEGGIGNQRQGQFRLASGEMLQVCVNQGGGAGSAGDGGPEGEAGAGGAGGGGSGVALQTSEGLSWLIVAGGGGGGGGGVLGLDEDKGGKGGGAEESGEAGQVAEGPGAGHGGALEGGGATGTSIGAGSAGGTPPDQVRGGAGGGGGGWVGGGGGFFSPAGAGFEGGPGGAGGVDFCATICAGARIGTGSGSVKIKYTVITTCSGVSGTGHVKPRGKGGLNFSDMLTTSGGRFSATTPGGVKVVLTSLEEASCVFGEGSARTFTARGTAKVGGKPGTVSLTIEKTASGGYVSLTVTQGEATIYSVTHEPLAHPERQHFREP